MLLSLFRVILSAVKKLAESLSMSNREMLRYAQHDTHH